MTDKPIVIGCDHTGVELKNQIIDHLKSKGFKTNDLGCFANEKCDYPDIAHAVCNEIVNKNSDYAVLICGTGIGVSMSANKIKGIRAALCGDYYSAKYTRLHNDANVLCMGARVIGAGVACEICDVFFSSDFEGGRHAARVDKLNALDNA